MVEERTLISYPIIIIGAARSGTNILRDVITRLPGLGTWPCDEINLIWRHGHRAFPTDEFTPEMASPEVCSFIRNEFKRIKSRYNLERVVEKTCANSLRVEYVHRIFPEAKYLFIVRDGRDVTASAKRRWQAPIDWSYTLKKAQFVPVPDIPFYAIRFLNNRIFQKRSPERRLGIWGPIFDGMKDMMESNSLVEVCANQWVRCVQSSMKAFQQCPEEKVHYLKYEDFVARPFDALKQIACFLDLQVAEEELKTITSQVFDHSVGKWKHDLDRDEILKVMPVLERMLKRLNYE